MRPANISGQHPSLPWPLQAPWDLLDHVTQVAEQLAQQPVEAPFGCFSDPAAIQLTR